jgi:hypothetical protein
MSSTSESAEEELVPVMVPRHLLTAVYRFIADQGAGTHGDVSQKSALHRGWTPPLVVEAYRAASDRMRVLLDLMASRPGERLYADDFMAALGVDRADFLNGVLGAFGRLTNQRFAPRLPDREHTWPFTVSKDIRDGRFYYEMPASVAQVIRQIER